MNRNYKVLDIKDFNDLQRYINYTEWCIIFTDIAFDYYLDNGNRRLYILERDDYQFLQPVESDGYPYDNYGLSLMAVIMNVDGTPFTITTRWNSLQEDEESIGIDFLQQILGKDIELLMK